MAYGRIYQIINTVNECVYIGQTTKTLDERMHEHIKHMKKADTPFYKALMEYGIEKFCIEEIEECETQKELDMKERYWIAFYKDKAYNVQDGGIRLSPVKCLNINDGSILHFPSMKAAADYFNEPEHNFIYKRCAGMTNYAYKGIWSFAYEDDDFHDMKTRKSNHRMKRIRVCKGNDDNIFLSYTDMEKFYGLRKGSIGGKAYRYRKRYGSKYSYHGYDIEELV